MSTILNTLQQIITVTQADPEIYCQMIFAEKCSQTQAEKSPDQDQRCSGLYKECVEFIKLYDQWKNIH